MSPPPRRLWPAFVCAIALTRLCTASQVDVLPSLIRKDSDSFPSCDQSAAERAFTVDLGAETTCASFCIDGVCGLNSTEYVAGAFLQGAIFPEGFAAIVCGSSRCDTFRMCTDDAGIMLGSAVEVNLPFPFSSFNFVCIRRPPFLSTDEKTTASSDGFFSVPLCTNAKMQKTASSCYVRESLTDGTLISTTERKIEIDEFGLITEGSCSGGSGASKALKGAGIAAGVVAVAALAGIAVWFKLKGVPLAVTEALKLGQPSGPNPGDQGKPDVEASMPPPPQTEISKVGDAYIARQLGEVARATQVSKGKPESEKSASKKEELPDGPPADVPKGWPLHLVIALDTSVRGCSRNSLVGDSRPAYSVAISNLLKALSVLAIGDVEVSLVTYAGDAVETILFRGGSLGATDLESVLPAIKAANPPRGAAHATTRATPYGSMQAVDAGLKILLDGEKDNPHRRRGRILLFNGGGVSENEMTQARQTSGAQPWITSHCVVVAGVGPLASGNGSGIDPRAAAQLGSVAVIGDDIEKFGVGDHAQVIKRVFESENPNGFRDKTFNSEFTVVDILG